MRLKVECWIALGAVLAFSSVLGHGFVYDDEWTVVKNAWLERPLGELVGLLASGQSLTEHVPDATRPTMVLSLWLDRRLFGLSPVGHHLDSLVLYGLDCWLATLLAFRLTHKRSAAWVLGTFFALAPLHAEPLAAINYREDLLSGGGVLAAWLLALGRPRGADETDSWRRAGGAAALFAVALFAKESAIVLAPLVGLTVLFLKRERDGVRGRPRLLLALSAVGVVWALWRALLAMRGDDIPLAPERGTVEQVLRSVRFMVRSVLQAVLPYDWAPDHWRQPDASAAWLAPFAILVVAIVLLGRARRGRIFALGLAVAMVAPLPSSPLFRPVNEIADRYFFLGVLGGGLVWGAGLALVAERFVITGWRRTLVALVCLPWLVPAWRAAGIWRDERALWTAAVERTPGSPRAWAALSRVHRGAGEERAAAVAVDRAVALDPSYAPALVTRVYNEIASGNLGRAREHLADIDRRGLGSYKGVRHARRCAVLEPRAARACVER